MTVLSFKFVRRGHALMDESPEYVQIVGIRVPHLIDLVRIRNPAACEFAVPESLSA